MSIVDNSAFHLVENGHDHIEGGTFAGILIHTDTYEFGQVGRYAAGNTNSQVLQSDLRQK